MSENYTLLLDIYGSLLPKSQQTALDLKYNSDLSISEIAEEMGGISRQSVNDFLKKGKLRLSKLESVFKSAIKYRYITDELDTASGIIKDLSKNNPDKRLDDLKALVERIRDIMEN